MAEPVEFWCGPDRPPRAKRDRLRTLDTTPGYGNVHLKIENISRKLVQTPPPLILDLLELASYVYAADQCVSRGGRSLRKHGEDWRRELTLNIPVRQLALWDTVSVRKALTDVLHFLSGDYFEFTFRQFKGVTEHQGYFEFDDGKPWFQADEVMLFSGGLDSFAGLCEAVKTRPSNIVLVSHRPAPQTDSLQRRLLDGFTDTTHSEDRLLHVPVWVNKGEQLTKDTTQRTRSFLYASLAASLAHLLSVDRVDFYENGITSSNLSIEPSQMAARASRTTHPRVLQGFTRLFTLLFGQAMTVENPYFWKTKADVVGMIKNLGLEQLIELTKSCSHVRTGELVQSHCGVCSQCVTRRLAIVADSLEDWDPSESYKIEHPLGPIDSEDGRAMVELIVKSAREFNRMNQGEFFSRHPEAFELVSSLGISTSEAASQVWELHKRHGCQVCDVMEKFVTQNKSLIARGAVPKDSLLSLIVGTKAIPKPLAVRRIPVPEGTRWEDITLEIVSKDSVRIKVPGHSKTYHFADLGFTDRRRGDLPTEQWQVLLDLAECGGTFSWATPKSKAGAYKRMQLLRRHLKSLFGLKTDPISGYKRGTGYVARFSVVDNRR